jgi:signal transduction histidine kinase
LERFFDPCFSLKDEGSRLSRAICLSFVQNHGGRIKVDSQVGRGTSIRVYLPCHLRAENRSQPLDRSFYPHRL